MKTNIKEFEVIINVEGVKHQRKRVFSNILMLALFENIHFSTYFGVVLRSPRSVPF